MPKKKNIHDFGEKQRFANIFSIPSYSSYLIYYKKCFYFFSKCNRIKVTGGKQLTLSGKRGPCNFFPISFGKKVKTLLYSKSGMRSKMELRKYLENTIFPQNHEICDYGIFEFFEKHKKTDFGV